MSNGLSKLLSYFGGKDRVTQLKEAMETPSVQSICKEKIDGLLNSFSCNVISITGQPHQQAFLNKIDKLFDDHRRLNHRNATYLEEIEVFHHALTKIASLHEGLEICDNADNFPNGRVFVSHGYFDAIQERLYIIDDIIKEMSLPENLNNDFTRATNQNYLNDIKGLETLKTTINQFVNRDYQPEAANMSYHIPPCHQRIFL